MFTVTPEESQSNKTSTSLERGLAFGSFECFRVNERWLIDATTVAYQSNINLGFRFLQQVWINNAKWVVCSLSMSWSKCSVASSCLAPV